MLSALPDFESETEEESCDELPKTQKKNHKFITAAEFSTLDEAKAFLNKRGFGYDYRIKANEKTDRKVA